MPSDLLACLMRCNNLGRWFLFGAEQRPDCAFKATLRNWRSRLGATRASLLYWKPLRLDSSALTGANDIPRMLFGESGEPTRLVRVGPQGARTASCGRVLLNARIRPLFCAEKKPASVSCCTYINRANKNRLACAGPSLLRNAEGNLDLAFGLHVKMCCGQVAGCVAKDFRRVSIRPLDSLFLDLQYLRFSVKRRTR